MATGQDDPDDEGPLPPRSGNALTRRVETGFAVTRSLVGLTEAYLLLSPLVPDEGTSTALVTITLTRAALHLVDSAHTIWRLKRR